MSTATRPSTRSAATRPCTHRAHAMHTRHAHTPCTRHAHAMHATPQVCSHQTNEETGERTYFVSWKGPAGGRENATRHTRKDDAMQVPYP